MSRLSRDVLDRTNAKVRVAFLDRERAKLWNARRKAGDTAVFCGWYWLRGSVEMGPFKTYSAAVRDAYYVVVLEREAPSIGLVRSNSVTALGRNERSLRLA